MAFHPQAPEMKKIFDKYGIQKLYHFTTIDNLSVIAEFGGLWSKQRLEQAGLLDRIITGGNELSLNLDRKLGNWDKVHLYFSPNTPMSYRVQENFGNRDPQSAHICYLVIDPVVALWNEVIFTDTNATANDHQKKGGIEGLKLVDFAIIKSTLLSGPKPWDRNWHRSIQAEVLVSDEIPLKYITSISFISKASLKEGQRLWENATHTSFNINIDKKLFHIGFPLVNDFMLTSQTVTSANVNSTQFQDERNFMKDLDSRITLFVNLYATAGTQAKVIWLDNNDNLISGDEIEFEKESGYWYWPSLEIVDLDEGNYSVEYYLSAIRWFKAHFKVRR